MAETGATRRQLLISPRSTICRIRTLTVSRRLLLVLLLLYAVKQVLTAVIFPPFSGHDEVAHYAYIRTVATEHRLPVIPDLDAVRAAQSRSDFPGDYLPDEH